MTGSTPLVAVVVVLSVLGSLVQGYYMPGNDNRKRESPYDSFFPPNENMAAAMNGFPMGNPGDMDQLKKSMESMSAAIESGLIPPEAMEEMSKNMGSLFPNGGNPFENGGNPFQNGAIPDFSQLPSGAGVKETDGNGNIDSLPPNFFEEMSKNGGNPDIDSLPPNFLEEMMKNGANPFQNGGMPDMSQILAAMKASGKYPLIDSLPPNVLEEMMKNGANPFENGGIPDFSKMLPDINETEAVPAVELVPTLQDVNMTEPVITNFTEPEITDNRFKELVEEKIEGMEDRMDLIENEMDAIKKLNWEPKNHCPTGFVEFSLTGKCYFISEDEMTYDEAQMACLKRGSYLINIETPRENKFARLQLRLNRDRKSFYIGAKREGKKFRWGHSYGKVKYTNWGPGTSHVNPFADCIEMKFFKNKMDYYWNESPCGEKKNYICERNQ